MPNQEKKHMNSNQWVAVYSGNNEVLVLPLSNGLPVDQAAYFENGGRDYNDYDYEVKRLPLAVSSGVSVN